MKPLTLPLLLLLPLAVRAADWPQWRGPDRTGISKETGLLKTWPKAGPKLLWTYKDTGVGYSGLSVVGKRLFTVGADGQNEQLQAIDVEAGKKEWSLDIAPKLNQDRGDGPRGTPTVEDGRVYCLSGRGDLVCAEVATGNKVWSVSLTGQELGGAIPKWGYSESPLVDGDWVLCSPGGSRGGIAALNKKDGKIAWQCKELTDPAGYSSIITATVGDVKQYITLTMKGVVGVRAKDGKLLWRYVQPDYKTAVVPTAIFHDNHVYATAGYGAGCDLLKLTPDGAGGTKHEVVYGKNKTMSNHHGGVLRIGEHIYGFSDRGGWMCQEMMTGKPVWSDRGVGKGSITCADGRLYCLGERDGTIALIEAAPTGWKDHGKFKIPEQSNKRRRGMVWTHPVVAHGKLFLRDQEFLFCYDIKDNASGRR